MSEVTPNGFRVKFQEWCQKPVGCDLQASGIIEEEFSMDNLTVRIRLIIEMIWWTGLALWEFEFPFPGSLRSTFPEWYPKPRLNAWTCVCEKASCI